MVYADEVEFIKLKGFNVSSLNPPLPHTIPSRACNSLGSIAGISFVNLKNLGKH